MKILILQDQLRVGGTERQSLFLAKTFNEAGHETRILTFRPGGHLCDNRHVGELGVEVLQKFDSRLSFWAPGLARKIRDLDPELILCMGRTANCYAGFVQKRFPRIPVVGSLRTGKVIFPLHHWSLGVVRAVLVNSNWWKRQLLRRNFPEDRIHVVHNALLLERNSDEYAWQRQRMRADYSINDETCVFLNVATFRPGKRHIDLLRVFAAIRDRYPHLDWRLWLVGDGKEYKRCQAWAAEKGLGTRIRFFHFQHDTLPFYAAADVAVSTSREDSLPNFLIEAQASSLPVVAYACRGVEETCLPGVTGRIIPAGDQETLLSSLLELAEDPELRRYLGGGAPEFVRKRFSREAQARATLEFLEGLVKLPGQASQNLS